ncbi:MAG: glycosyltransferase, partial [Bacteroidota bacterium]
MKNILFFFTATYPYGFGETFIENEIHYLAKSFDSIIIVSNNLTDTQTRKVPSNVTCLRMNYELSYAQKLSALTHIFHPLFWHEIQIIRTRYKKRISRLILFTVLQSLQKALFLKKKIQKIITTHSHTNDSIYLYSYWNNDTAFALSYLKQSILTQKCISRAHRWDVYFEVNKAQYLPFKQYILEKSDGISFIAEEGANYYKNLFPEYANKMYLSHLGVNIPDIQAAKKHNHLRIVSCSNIIPVKRVHVIAEALEKISPEITIEWIHFGAGTELNSLQEYCKKKLNPLAHISYTFAGQKTNKEVLSFYSKNYIDIFINVSSSEGIPVSIMEAQSYGIPCIATDVGGNS